MSDLLNFDDDEDNLFQPQEQQNKPSRNLDDIFGTNPESNQSDNTLDDILTPSVQDDIFQTKSTPKKAQNSVKNVDSLFGDVDDEPDIFSSNFASSQKSETKNISNPLEGDLLGDFLQPSVNNEDKTKSNDADLIQDDLKEKPTNEIDDFFGFGQSDSASVTQQDNQSRARSKSHDGMSADESADSLDILLSAQPMGSVPSCDDLLSLVEPITNTDISSNKHAAQNSNSKDSSNIEKDPLDDFFGNSEPNHPKELPEETIEEENKLLEEPEEVEASKPLEELEEKEASEPLEESEDEIKPLEDKEEVNSDSDIEEPPVTKPKTNLKKSMERSFEDLLTGLSDESEPELDDMIVADIDNTNLESLLETPDKSHRDSNQQTSNKFSTPSKPLDLDLLSSTPMDKSAGSPEVKVTTPDVKVITPDDKEEWIDRDDASFNENDVVMRPKKEYVADYADGDDVDLEAIEDTNHLDVDVNKHKSALGKKGSLALRRKPSRKSRKSLLSSGDDAIFQDSTDSKPVSMTNGNDDDDNDDDGYDLSPPAKKPSPAVMLPLPGMAGRPPSQRKSSVEADNDDNAMDTKEVKRSSKPPPGAFVLPSFSPSPAKPKRSPSDASDRPTVESKPAVFEKPALRSVKPVEKSPAPEEDEKPAFSRAGLRSSNKPETVTKDVSQERDITFQKPALRSTPKPRREKSPEENMDIGVFEKPQLRSTPKPKLEQKFTDDKDNDIFEQTNLRSVQKQETNTIKETASDKHVFEKPSFRNTGRKIENDIDNVKEETHTKTFEKPALRTTNKLPRADSVTDHSEPVHTFDKPPLRSTSRPSVDKQTDSSSTGVFEKPSLKKTTPSPEKEAKDLNEPKGMFDKPALRKTERERKESPKLSEKPEWLQQAANKHSKVLGAVHTKENSHNNIDKETPSWLETPVLRKTRGQPLQDSSNGQSTTSSHSDLSHNDESSKQVSTPRSRNSSMSSESEHEKRSTPSSTVKESHNNYTPSWMRQTRSPSMPTPGVLGPAKSLPSLSGSGEVPAWKRELAQRRQSRKEKTPEEIPKTETSAEPEWKKGIQLRKTRNTPQPKESSEEVKSVEPEWKKAAEERHARLRNSTVHDKADQ